MVHRASLGYGPVYDLEQSAQMLATTLCYFLSVSFFRRQVATNIDSKHTARILLRQVKGVPVVTERKLCIMSYRFSHWRSFSMTAGSQCQKIMDFE